MDFDLCINNRAGSLIRNFIVGHLRAAETSWGRLRLVEAWEGYFVYNDSRFTIGM